MTNVYTTQYSVVFMHCGMARRADWLTHCHTYCETLIRISQSTLSVIFNYETRCHLATGCVLGQVHMILYMGMCSCTCVCIHMCVEDSFSVILHCATWFRRQGLCEASKEYTHLCFPSAGIRGTHHNVGARNLTLVLMHGQQEHTEWITSYATSYSFSYPLLIWDFIEISFVSLASEI